MDILTLIEDYPEAGSSAPNLKERLEHLRNTVLTIP
jgi:hypothetical protein